MIKNAFFILLMSTAITSFAEDLSPGAVKAATACALCHGANGLATLPNAPNLAGQQAFYLTEQLNNYRNGKRQHEGAPKAGEKTAWAPRIAKGKPTLYEHAIKGFNAMPAKGGNAALADADVKAAVDYMVALIK